MILPNSSRIPWDPSTRRVISRLLKLGPRSIAGNIRIPAVFEIGSPCRSLGAVTANAADHEIAKVRQKYEVMGRRAIMELVTLGCAARFLPGTI